MGKDPLPYQPNHFAEQNARADSKGG